MTETLALLAVAAAYWVPYRLRARRLRGQGRPVAGWRQACFAAGLACFAIALSSPADRLSDRLLYLHMAQHVLLIDGAALLLVLGLTAPLLAPVLRLRPVQRLRRLMHPAVAISVWTVTIAVWHLPVLYGAALSNDAIHGFEHWCFLVSGLLLWAGLFGPLPKPAWFGNWARLGYPVAIWLVGMVVGAVFLVWRSVLYAHYIHDQAVAGISPLTDQRLAGVVMMGEGTILAVVIAAWLFGRAMRDEEQVQQLVDHARRHGVLLSRARAARAVAAGQGPRLRDRIAPAAPPSAGGAPPGGTARAR